MQNNNDFSFRVSHILKSAGFVVIILGILAGWAQQLSGSFVILNAQSGKAISVDNAGTANGSKIHQWTNNQATEQVWIVSEAESGLVRLVNKLSSKVLDVYSGSTHEGARLHLWETAPVASQKWELQEAGNSEYILVNSKSGKVAAINSGSASNGDSIFLQEKSGSAHQKWKLQKVADDIFVPQGAITNHKNFNTPKTEPLIPKWAFGYWQSQWGEASWGYSDRDGFMDHAKTLRGILPNRYGDHKHPADVMVLDMYWTERFDTKEGWNWPGNMKWSHARYPRPAEMFSELHKMNMKISLNYHNIDAVADGKIIQPWLDSMKTHLQWGADVVWLDFWSVGSEPEKQVWNLLADVWGNNKRRMMFTRHFTRPNYHHLESHPEWGIIGSLKLPNEDPIQKTMPVHWTGDVDGTWEGFQETIEGIVYGIDGVMDGWSYMHADCPGHSKGIDGELAIRWIQFSDFSPITRNHGYTPRDVWAWGPKIEKYSVASRLLRYRLLPYIYTYSWHIYNDALPLTRPLRLAYPGQRDDIRWSYMFGQELLVAPVYKAASQFPNNKMDVFLPKGEQWVDYWTHQIHEGGKTIKVDVSEANQDKIPLFVKRGAVIPMGPEIYFIDPKVHPDPLTLDIYPLETGESGFTLYDDDGETMGYTKGEYALAPFKCITTADSVKVLIEKETGTYPEKPQQRVTLLKINLQPKAPSGINFNNSALTQQTLGNVMKGQQGWAYDDSSNTVWIAVSVSVKQSYEVAFKKGGSSPIGSWTKGRQPLGQVKIHGKSDLWIQAGEEPIRIKVVDLQGRVELATSLRANAQILKKMAPGLYIVKLEKGQQQKSWRVLAH